MTVETYRGFEVFAWVKDDLKTLDAFLRGIDVALDRSPATEPEPEPEPEPPMSHNRRQYEHVAATMAEVSRLPERDDDSTNASTAAGMAGLAAQMAEVCGVDHRGWEFARAGWRAAAKAWAAVAKSREAMVAGPQKPGNSGVPRLPRLGDGTTQMEAYDMVRICQEAADAWRRRAEKNIR